MAVVAVSAATSGPGQTFGAAGFVPQTTHPSGSIAYENRPTLTHFFHRFISFPGTLMFAVRKSAL